MKIGIPAREGDDEQFRRMVKRVLLGTLAGADGSGVTLVRIDGWFGARYLGEGLPEFPAERIEEEIRLDPAADEAERGVILWFSGNSARQRTGSVMVRAVGTGWDGGWHASFVREEKGWSLRQGSGIDAARFAALIERGRA